MEEGENCPFQNIAIKHIVMQKRQKENLMPLSDEFLEQTKKKIHTYDQNFDPERKYFFLQSRSSERSKKAKLTAPEGVRKPVSFLYTTPVMRTIKGAPIPNLFVKEHFKVRDPITRFTHRKQVDPAPN